ncbi:DUF2085 domain-containing protein [Cytobacillus sp. FJAT-54145]|uniref:DUF2085 domain-containing protein n=1 Tax=Cytobacillus spartinae TaxID=3299023 RepID=A0ABW6KEZ8_9BACI
MLEEISFFIGKAICHQLPERSIIIDGHSLPFCARCTGIYIGICSTLIYFTLTKKFRATTIPSIKLSLMLLLLLFPLIVDGLGSYLTIFPSNNVTRITTGFIFGPSLPFFLVPLLRSGARSIEEIPIIKKVHEMLLPILSSGIVSFLVFQALIPAGVLSLFLTLTLVVWVSLLFFLFFKRFQRRYISISLSLLCSVLSLIFMSHLHTISSTLLEKV